MGKAGNADESFGNTTGQKAESLGKDISPLVRNEITMVLGNFSGARDVIKRCYRSQNCLHNQFLPEA